MELGLTFPSFVKLAGKDPNGALVFENPSKTYAIHWVTRTQNANDARLARFIKIYNEDPEVMPLLTKRYSGQIGFGWQSGEAELTVELRRVTLQGHTCP